MCLFEWLARALAQPIIHLSMALLFFALVPPDVVICFGGDKEKNQASITWMEVLDKEHASALSDQMLYMNCRWWKSSHSVVSLALHEFIEQTPFFPFVSSAQSTTDNNISTKACLRCRMACAAKGNLGNVTHSSSSINKHLSHTNFGAKWSRRYTHSIELLLP